MPTLTRQMYFDMITDGLWDLLPSDGSGVNADTARACVNQNIENLNNLTVNPDAATRPVIKGFA